MVVPISRVALVTAGLSQLEGVRSTAHFVVAIIRGLGGSLTQATQEAFAKAVRGTTIQVKNLPQSQQKQCVQLRRSLPKKK